MTSLPPRPRLLGHGQGSGDDGGAGMVPSEAESVLGLDRLGGGAVEKCRVVDAGLEPAAQGRSGLRVRPGNVRRTLPSKPRPAPASRRRWRRSPACRASPCRPPRREGAPKKRRRRTRPAFCVLFRMSSLSKASHVAPPLIGRDHPVRVEDLPHDPELLFGGRLRLVHVIGHLEVPGGVLAAPRRSRCPDDRSPDRLLPWPCRSAGRPCW